MDCQTALEYLDCVRPDSDDLDLPELVEAREHLQSCESCQREFAARQDFDLAVMETAQDVEIPAGLRASLLTAMEAEASESAADDVAVVPAADFPEAELASGSKAASSSLRRAFRVVTAAACGMALAFAAWLWQSGPVQLTEDELLERIPIDLSATVVFDSGFDVPLPATWSANRRLRVSQEFRGIDLDDNPGHDAAVAIFHFLSSRNAPVSGIIAAIPASRVEPLPSAVSFSRADSQYIQKNGRPVAAVWQEGNLVYVCFVLGSAAVLERIQRNLSRSAA